MRRKSIGLVGYFGWGNFGDELFLKAHREYLSDIFDLSVVHDLFEEPYFSPDAEAHLDTYDAFLVGGGDLINPARVSGLYWRMKYLNRPTYVFGIGVPSRGGISERALTAYRQFFQHPNCRLTVARDQESMKWITKHLEPVGRVTWHPDPVCAMARPPASTQESKVLGVVMRGHRSLKPDFAPVRKLVDYAKSLEYDVRHLVLATGSIRDIDREIAEEIARPGEPVVFSDSLDDLCQQISACSLLATIKFHGMVVATMYGVPSIAMSVTPKNKNFLKMIDRKEMSAPYSAPDLWKRLPYYPAPIHQLVRGSLFRRAKEGYLLLRHEMARDLGVNLDGSALAAGQPKS